MTDGARIIWVLFGDLEGVKGGETACVNELCAIYWRYKGKLESRGFSLGMKYIPPEEGKSDSRLGMSQGRTSKKAFLQLVAEPATVAVVWHSHGVQNQWGLTGEISADCGARINPRDITVVSPRLQFVALLACIGSSAHATSWSTAFRFPIVKSPAPSRLTTIGNDRGYMSREDMIMFATTRTGRLGPYTFKMWLDESQA